MSSRMWLHVGYREIRVKYIVGSSNSETNGEEPTPCSL